ncbi:MAG TPA: D-alanyl-D-alanine carboxypeptidase/D-alanyl-D-alanine-endopeptidase [Jatrophihabitantaceae bacterium]|nr:D-alanyl-D-alanine carboxypeptidase/D-alanyl-D-alanine-endopeptidase [Jatrophihabitantaceae bacterium]
MGWRSSRRIQRWRRPRRTTRQRVLLGLGVVLAVVLLGGVGGGGYLVSRDVRRHLDPAPTPPPTPSALVQATATPPTASPPAAAPPARAAAVAAAIRAAVHAPGLGGRLLAQVVDAETGTVLYTQSPAIAAAPASTAKLVTTAAVLATRGPDYRIVTSVRARAGTLYLVGGGDPTLTGASGKAVPAYPGAAKLADLAAAVKSAKVPMRRIVIVDSAFSGPSVSPSWASDDVPSAFGAPITAVMLDGGRATPGAVVRTNSPDLVAGRRLAALLGKPALPVTRGLADPGASEVGQVQSAPMSVLVQQTLEQSDNVLAEMLARQVAIATNQPASFLGAAKAIRTTLAGLGVDVGGAMVDGSGLAARDRISPSALVAVLRIVVDPTRPALHGVVAGLPVAGWSGTLASRYLSGTSVVGAGAVRAKTGTLTGVSSLAGYIHDAGGRLLAFAFLADKVPASEAGTIAAEGALDRIASSLAACVCR